MTQPFLGLDGQYVLRRRTFDCQAKEVARGIDTPTIGASQGRPLTDMDDAALRQYQMYHFDIDTTTSMTLANVRLSDQGVFWALGHLTATQRSKRFPYDFESHGDVRVCRVPRDPPVVIWAHGLPWFAAVKSTYLLCGRFAEALGHITGTSTHTSSGRGVATYVELGAVLAPPEAVAAAGNSIHLLKDSTKHYTTYEPMDILHRGRDNVEVCMTLQDTVYNVLSETTVATIDLSVLPGFRSCVATGEAASLMQNYYDTHNMTWDNQSAVSDFTARILGSKTVDWDNVGANRVTNKRKSTKVPKPRPRGGTQQPANQVQQSTAQLPPQTIPQPTTPAQAQAVPQPTTPAQAQPVPQPASQVQPTSTNQSWATGFGQPSAWTFSPAQAQAVPQPTTPAQAQPVPQPASQVQPTSANQSWATGFGQPSAWNLPPAQAQPVPQPTTPAQAQPVPQPASQVQPTSTNQSWATGFGQPSAWTFSPAQGQTTNLANTQMSAQPVSQSSVPASSQQLLLQPAPQFSPTQAHMTTPSGVQTPTQGSLLRQPLTPQSLQQAQVSPLPATSASSNHFGAYTGPSGFASLAMRSSSPNAPSQASYTGTRSASPLSQWNNQQLPPQRFVDLVQRPVDIGTRYQSDGLGNKIEALDDIDDVIVPELTHALKRMNYLRQTIDGHRPCMWLAASWPHNVSLFSEIRLTLNQNHGQMHKFWAAVSSADGKRIENAMRFAEALDNFDLRLDNMEPGLLADAVQDILVDMKSNWADIEL